MMSKLFEVIRHEFKMVAANKAFVILTIVGPFVLVAISVLPALLSSNTEIKDVDIAVVGADMDMMQRIEGPLAASNVNVSASSADRTELEEMVLDGELYGFLELPADILSAGTLTLYSKEIADYRITGVLQGVIGQEITGRRLAEEGLDPQVVRRLSAYPTVDAVRLSRKGSRVEGEPQDFMSAMLTGIAFTIMLYMTILIYGQAIGRSVLNEKVSKTVEIVLSSVSPLDLLFGKILGHTIASLLQYAVWIGMGLVFINVLKPVIGVTGLPRIPVSLIGYLLLFFLLGFFLYTALFSAMGSASQDESHFAQLSWPVIIFLVVPMVAVSGIIMNPNSSLVVFLSLFPMTAAIVTFIRLVVTDPPTWQIVLSVAIQAVSVAGVILLSAKIFRVGILMTGKRSKLGEIVKWLKA